MPRLPIDYSKTIIYKICCNDVNITDIYVGHTTDLVRRRCNHKSNCNNENKKEYNYNVYQFIRENGGWDNWKIIPIEEFPCENINQALIRERYYIEELKSSLNKVIPSRTKQEWSKKYNKEYANNNKTNINEKRRERYKTIKEVVNKKNKEYYKNNKETILEKQKEKFNCECGGKYTHTHKNRHLTTKKHQNYLTQTIPANNLT